MFLGSMLYFFFSYWLFPIFSSGGFSVVKRGQAIRSKKFVAIKIIPQSFAQNQILDREINIMKQIGSHPNILELYDVFVSKKV